MCHLDGRGQVAKLDGLVNPVELEGIYGVKTQRNVGIPLQEARILEIR